MERFEEFVDNLNRKGFQIPEAELAVQSIYDEGFKAGWKKAEHDIVMPSEDSRFMSRELEKAQQEAYDKAIKLIKKHNNRIKVVAELEAMKKKMVK
jgi:hypothetical protein